MQPCGRIYYSNVS